MPMAMLALYLFNRHFTCNLLRLFFNLVQTTAQKDKHVALFPQLRLNFLKGPIDAKRYRLFDMHLVLRFAHAQIDPHFVAEV